MHPFPSPLLMANSGVVSDRWWVKIRGAVLPGTLAGSAQQSIAELKFMTSAGAGANAGTGSTITPSGTWVSASSAFDNDVTTFANSGTAECQIGFLFDTPKPITHISITARNNGNWNQVPSCFDVYYSNDGGVTPQLIRHIPVGGPWTTGETKVFDLSTNGYTSENLSALDEVGGYRYYAIKATGNSFGGSTSCNVAELLLKNGSTKIQTQMHRNRASPTISSSSSSFPCDGEVAGFFALNNGSYVIIDMGYKRVITSFGYTARTSTFGTQAPTKLELYGLTGSMANDASWTLAEMTLLKSVDDSASATPTSNEERTFSYP